MSAAGHPAEPQGKQERVQLRTVEHIADVVPMVQILDISLPRMDIRIPEQAIEVPKISSSSRLSCRRRVLLLPQTAEQLVEVLTIVSVSSLRALVEQNVQFLMVVAGWLGGEVFKVLVMDRVQQLHHLSHVMLRMSLVMVFFRTSLQNKKVHLSLRVRVRGCMGTRAHPS